MKATFQQNTKQAIRHSDVYGAMNYAIVDGSFSSPNQWGIMTVEDRGQHRVGRYEFDRPNNSITFDTGWVLENHRELTRITFPDSASAWKAAREIAEVCYQATN